MSTLKLLKVALVVIILSTILGIVSVIALLEAYYTIPSSGSIGLLETQPSVAKSEIRALFVHSMSAINPDWDLITQTAKDYGINTLVIEAMGNNYVLYPSDYVPGGSDLLTPAITAAHARGMELHISMNVLLSTPGDEYKSVTADGTLVDWMDPTNPNSRTLLRNLVEEVTTEYDIDGFMFDYIRYDSDNVPYGEYARQSLETYLGETITNWSGDFAPGGSRHKEFLEWRIQPINDLVRDMRSWMLAIKPDLEFSAAVFQYLYEGGVDYPTYWRMWIGQDWAYWVKEGYIDWVAPMMYETDPTQLGNYVRNSLQYGLGGPEGKIPLVPFLANCYPGTVDPNNFKQQIDAVRANGADGWIIWRYGGPGDGEGSGAPDIRNYLSLIDLPQQFSLKDVTVLPDEVNGTATITWTTDLPATSKVEYSASSLFTYSFDYIAFHDFNYWNVNHVEGTIVQDSTNVTSHQITLTDLQVGTLYYYRIQSQDQSGIATSEVNVFEV